jgi:hypothetical protein
VRGMGRLSERPRDRVLNDEELRSIWQAADGSIFGSYLRFLLLTAARRNEAARTERGELSGADWTLPAARNKTDQDLVRPLSKAALAIVAELPRLGKFVFSRRGKAALGSFGVLKEEIDRASSVTGWTLHDLRRTARSLMSRAGVPADHAERCLGHVIGGVRGTYDRHEYHDEKAKAFEALASLDTSLSGRFAPGGYVAGSEESVSYPLVQDHGQLGHRSRLKNPSATQSTICPRRGPPLRSPVPFPETRPRRLRSPSPPSGR